MGCLLSGYFGSKYIFEGHKACRKPCLKGPDGANCSEVRGSTRVLSQRADWNNTPCFLAEAPAIQTLQCWLSEVSEVNKLIVVEEVE